MLNRGWPAWRAAWTWGAPSSRLRTMYAWPPRLQTLYKQKALRTAGGSPPPQPTWRPSPVSGCSMGVNTMTPRPCLWLQCGCDTMVIGSRGLGITRRAMLNLFGLGSGARGVA